MSKLFKKSTILKLSLLAVSASILSVSIDAKADVFTGTVDVYEAVAIAQTGNMDFGIVQLPGAGQNHTFTISVADLLSTAGGTIISSVGAVAGDFDITGSASGTIDIIASPNAIVGGVLFTQFTGTYTGGTTDGDLDVGFTGEPAPTTGGTALIVGATITIDGDIAVDGTVAPSYNVDVAYN